MIGADDHLIVAGLAGGLAMSLMLGLKLISAKRFAQALGGGLTGLVLIKAALVMGGADHG